MTNDRILFVLNRVDDASGGTLGAAVNTARALVGAGVGITFAVPVGAGQVTQTIDAIGDAPGVTVHKFRASAPLARFGGSVRHIAWLWRHIREFDNVHIHSAFYVGAVYTALIARMRRVPYFVWPHGSLDPYDLQKHERVKAPVGRLIMRPMLSSSASVLCTTPREADVLQTYGAEVRRSVVPLPVEPAGASTVDRTRWRADHGISADSFVLLFLGRIAPKKGLPRLIDALVLLADVDVVLVVAGAGEDERDGARASEHADSVGVADRVRFLGWLGEADRADALAACDAFGLPSDNENFGIAVVEALLAGLPVIISDEVYIGEVLNDAGGATITARDPASIAGAVRAMLADRAAADTTARSGRDYALANFAPGAVARTLITEMTDATTAGR